MTTPTRDELLLALGNADGQSWSLPDAEGKSNFYRHTAEMMYGEQADAVLALLAAPPAPAPSSDVALLVQAIVHTVEYVGTDVLPAIPGWSWYDALVKVAPAEAERLAIPPRPVYVADLPTADVPTEPGVPLEVPADAPTNVGSSDEGRDELAELLAAAIRDGSAETPEDAADVLRAHGYGKVAQAKAEALRDAAEAVNRIDPSWDSALWIEPPGHFLPVPEWLRARADRIAATCGHPNHGSEGHDCTPFRAAAPHESPHVYDAQPCNRAACRCDHPACGDDREDRT